MEISNRIAIGINYPVGDDFPEELLKEDTAYISGIILKDTEWVDVRYTVNLHLIDLENNDIDGAEIIFNENQDQEEVVVVTNELGGATAMIIPYSSVYDVDIIHNQTEESLGLLIDDHEETREMFVDLQLLEGADKLADTANSITNDLIDIEWQLVE